MSPKTSIIKKIFKLKPKYLFPTIYILILIFGLLLFLLNLILPSLIFCGMLSGTKFCTPLGLYLMLVTSLPGYLLAGSIFGINAKTPLAFSLLMVFILTLISYFFVGWIFSWFKNKKLDATRVSIVTTVAIFVVLIIIFTILLV